MGIIYGTLGDHEAAVEQFIGAITLDRYQAVASVSLTVMHKIISLTVYPWNRYFQCGVSNFMLARYEPAYKDFQEAHLYMRGNEIMYYHSLSMLTVN